MPDLNDLGDLTLRLVAQPQDVNFNGHAFGGWILSQMDIAGGVVASRHSRGPIATVAVEAMEFHKPVHIGDYLSIYTRLAKTGRTSMTVDITIIAQRRADRDTDSDDLVKVTEGRFIYVAIDENVEPRALPK